MAEGPGSLIRPLPKDNETIFNSHPVLKKKNPLQFNNPFFENCFIKGLIGGGAGFGMGMFFGLLMSSFETHPYNTAIDTNLSTMTQIKLQFKQMGTRSWTTGKQFGAVGLIYSFVECGIDKWRAKHSMVNTISAGCLTGGLLTIRGGPQAAGLGCAGFAAFSAAIEHFTHS